MGGFRVLNLFGCRYKENKWNPDFSNPHFFRPPDASNQESFPFPQSNTVILPPIVQTLRFFKPIFVSLGGSKNWDSTVVC